MAIPHKIACVSRQCSNAQVVSVTTLSFQRFVSGVAAAAAAAPSSSRRVGRPETRSARVTSWLSGLIIDSRLTGYCTIARPHRLASTSNTMSSSATTAAGAQGSNEKGTAGKVGATTNTTTITEGSVTMTFPNDQATSVFYNPVQVQNRDLSVLIMTVYAEQRAVRMAVHDQRQIWKKQYKHDELTEKLHEYEHSLDPATTLFAAASSHRNRLTVLDALAASGLRSLRYWNEVPGLQHVTINDLDEAAVQRARHNIVHNGLATVLLETNVAAGSARATITAEHDQQQQRPYGLYVQHGDATHIMYTSRRPPPPPTTTASGDNTNDPRYLHQAPQFDVIDLDPYGSAAPFLDAALQAVRHGGLLNITCTDMAALGGAHPETAFGRYGALPLQRAPYLQEMAVRVLLYHVATVAAKYGRTIQPVLSVGMDFYIRCFVIVWDDKARVNELSLHIGHVLQSTQCGSYWLAPCSQMGGKKNKVYQAHRMSRHECEQTGAALKLGGPIWLGPLHDATYVHAALSKLEATTPETTMPRRHFLATRDRLRGLLHSCAEELPQVPLYHVLSHLAQTLGMSSPKLVEFKAALRQAGYKVSGYHKEPHAIKTDAPNAVVWDLLKLFYRRRPPAKAPAEGSAAAKILAQPPVLPAQFVLSSYIPDELARRRGNDVARFPLNPQAHWGPKRAATGDKTKRSAASKKAKSSSPDEEI